MIKKIELAGLVVLDGDWLLRSVIDHHILARTACEL